MLHDHHGTLGTHGTHGTPPDTEHFAAQFQGGFSRSATNRERSHGALVVFLILLKMGVFKISS